MLAVTLVVSCLFAFGFYAYVLIQLRREMKRGDAVKKRVPEHLYQMDHEPRRGTPVGCETGGAFRSERVCKIRFAE